MKKRNFKWILILVMLLFTFLSFIPMCAQDSTENTISLSGNSDIVSANTKFGIKLFKEIYKGQEKENIFISPLSISMILTVASNGAAGETLNEMTKTLELQDQNFNEINENNLKLIKYLKNIKDVELNIANSFWGKKDFSFKKEFIEINKKFYEADVQTLDFSNPKASKIINQWVSDKTKDKIKEVVPSQIPDDLVLFLINAIYFKGNWTYEFNEEYTQEKDFYLLDGSIKKHPLMALNKNFMYYEDDNVQGISLPYGGNEEEPGNISMYIFLPKENYNLNQFFKDLNYDKWEKLIGSFDWMEGYIELPKFRLEYEKNLNDILKSLGINKAFSDQADFSKMTKEQVLINSVFHKSFVEVNEKGTEAAAVTVISVGITSVEVKETFTMIVNKPFFFVIRDNETGTILFMGNVTNPL